MVTKEAFKTSGDMLAWQWRQVLAQLDQVQLHASDSTCPCRLRDEGEYCIPKHLNSLSYLAMETAAMDSRNSDILFDLGEDAAQMHLATKDHVCGKGKDIDLVTWSRQWRKKIEPLYYACPGRKKAKMSDVVQLFDPLIRIAGKCVDEDCSFKVSHTDKIEMPAGSIKTLPQSIKDVLAALDKKEITASDMTFAFGTTGLLRYELRFRIMDAESLICSHDPHTFEENPKFPQELQPRDRTRVATQLQVLNIAKNINPDLLLVDFRSTDKGAPIIYKDLIVESGNGRAMALKLAADQVPAKLEEYRNALKLIAPAYALDPADADKYKIPILVRERLTEVNNRKSFVDDCNARSTLAMSAIEQAKRDAEKITFVMLNSLELLEGESFDQALRAARNNRFLVQFLNALPANDRASLVDAKGVVNSEGVRRAILATFVATFKGEVGLRLAQAQFEELDNDVKVALAGIAGSLGFLAQAENLALTKAREPELSIGEDLAIAVRKWGQIKRITDYTVAKYLAQQQMGTRELTPFQERVLKVLSDNARSSKRIAGIFTAYAQKVIASPPPSQVRFIPEARLTKEEIFESAVKSVIQPVAGMAELANLFEKSTPEIWMTKFEKCNLSPEEMAIVLSWRPLRDFAAFAIGLRKPVQLCSIGMVAGVYQLTIRELDMQHQAQATNRAKSVPNIKRVYTPYREVVYEIVLPTEEASKLTWKPQEISTAQARVPVGAQAALFERGLKTMRKPESVKITGKCDGEIEGCNFKVTKVGSSASGQGVSGLTKAINAVSSGAAEPADIPAALGSCKKIKIHDDGDLTVRCGKDLYVVTTEGKAFKQVALNEPLEAPMRLLTKEILARLPPLYSQENVKDPIVQVKFFHPMGSWTWYAIEYDPKERLFFGWSPEDNEMGYASYDELSEIRVRGLGIERDKYFDPKPLSQVKKQEHQDAGDDEDDEPIGAKQGKLFERRKPKKVERTNGKVVKHYLDSRGMHKGSIRVKTLPTGALVYLGCPKDETWHPPSSCSRQVVIKTVTPVVRASEVDPDIKDAIEHPVEVDS